MAELRIDGNQLALHLSAAEKLEAVHGDLRAPLSAVRGVDVLNDAHAPVGVRAGIKIGTRIPGVIEVGIVQGAAQRLFAAVHRDTPRAARPFRGDLRRRSRRSPPDSACPGLSRPTWLRRPAG